MCHLQLYRAARLNPTSHGIWIHGKRCRALRIQRVDDLVTVRLIGSRARHTPAGRRAICPSQVHVVTFTRPRLLLVRERAYGLGDTTG